MLQKRGRRKTLTIPKTTTIPTTTTTTPTTTTIHPMSAIASWCDICEYKIVILFNSHVNNSLARGVLHGFPICAGFPSVFFPSAHFPFCVGFPSMWFSFLDINHVEIFSSPVMIHAQMIFMLNHWIFCFNEVGTDQLTHGMTYGQTDRWTDRQSVV